MLYNLNLKRKKKMTDWLECKFFDRKNKKCNGLGNVCFEYDLKTGIIKDPKTGLPIKSI